MNRKKVLGRAALSFPTIDGILDMDQLLETDPCNQINDFVQHNFMQNILDEFNERLTLNPKLTPADNKSPGKKQTASASGTTRKSQPGQTNEDKPATGEKNGPVAAGDASKARRRSKLSKGSETGEAEPAKTRGKKGRLDGAQKTEGKSKSTEKTEAKPKSAEKTEAKPKSTEKTEAKPKSAAGRKKQEELKDQTNDRKDQGKPIKNVKKTNRSTEDTSNSGNGTEKQKTNKKAEQKLKVGPKPTIKRKSMPASFKNKVTEAITDAPTEETNNPVESSETENAIENKSSATMNIAKNAKSRSPIITSTPKREVSPVSNFIWKETATTERIVSPPKKDSPATTNDASSWNRCARDCCYATKDANNNYNVFPTAEHGNEQAETAGVKCGSGTTGVTKSVKNNEREFENDPTFRTPTSTRKTCKRNKHKGKTATTAEGKKIGKFEKRLLEKRERRQRRRIRRHERKAERAMVKFSRHVTRIAKQMGYMPESSSSSSKDDRYHSSSSDQSSYYDSCCSHSSSCCSCSCSSCSCYSSCSCSSEYSEYTICSTSD